MLLYISLMILSILFTVFSATTYASFSDVPSTHPNAVAVEWAQAKGIVSGYDDNTFKPDSTINRAEFVKILLGSKYDLYEIEYTDFLDNHDFTDVPANVWYEPYILFAWQKNIIDGYADKTFRASNTINLAEAAKIITNVQLEKPLEPMGTYWYEAYIQYLQNYNALPSNTDPAYRITRGDMVEMMYDFNESTLCTAKPRMVTNAAYGSIEELYPVSAKYYRGYDDKYQIMALFTTIDCGNERVQQFFPQQEYADVAVSVNANNPQLETFLINNGFTAQSQYFDELKNLPIKRWGINIVSLETLKALYEFRNDIFSSDCTKCG
jgi:S-layer homology domain